ncbi:MAG: NACHT domain-containing NTPase, partial [Anaerolineae bacterium]
MATSPLYLTMLATLNDAGREMPQTRAALFAAYCSLILGRAKGEMTSEQVLHLLELLAYRMITDRNLVLALSEVARVSAVSGDALVNSSGGLLVRDTEGQCRFVHASLQCYLAAAYAVEAQLVVELEARAVAPDIWWHQTIRFFASMSDASSIVMACLEQPSPTPEALNLLVSCVRESKDLSHGVQRRFEGMLQVWIEDTDPHRRQSAAEALLSLRLDRFGPDNVAQHLVTHAEYQIFLDERRERGRYLQPDHWLDYRFPPGLGTRPVVGVRLSDAAAYCEWLTQRGDGAWHLRLPRVGEGKKNATAGSWALSGEGEDAACIDGAPALDTGRVEQYVVLTLARDLARAHGRDHDLERARTIAVARASDLSRVPARVSVSASDLDRALSRARTSDVILSRAQDVALARVIDLTVSLARERSEENGLDLTRARAFAALGERLIDPDLANDLASAIDRARDRVVDRAIDRVLGNVISLDLARSSEVAARLSRSLEGARGLVDAIDQARACAARLEQGAGGVIVRTADQARDLSRAVAQAGDAAHSAARQLTERVERGLVRAGELAGESDLAEALNLPTVIDRARTLSLARARDLAGVGDFGVASDQVGALALDLDLARTRTSELATHVTRESADSLVYALSR